MKTSIAHVAFSVLALSQILPALQTTKPELLFDINRASKSPRHSYPKGVLARPDASWQTARFQKVGKHVFFQAQTVATGTELYACTSQLGSAKLVVDLFKGTGSSNPTEFMELGGKLYFKATDGSSGYQVYEASVGTSSITVNKLTALPNTSYVDEIGTLIGVGNYLYFTAKDTVTSQYHIHRVDLTTRKSYRYSNALLLHWQSPVSLGARIVFEGKDGQGKEAWWLDGDKLGYIRNYSGSADGRCFYPIATGGLVYFSSFDGKWGIWKWGPTVGTKKVMDLNLTYGWYEPVVLGKRLIFNGGAGEPFSVDPTAATPKILSLPSGSNERGMLTPIVFGNKLYYYGYSSKQSYAGYYLFETDGLTSKSIDGTRAYTSGTGFWTAPVVVPATKPYLLFGFKSGSPGDSLYKYDGTTFQRLLEIHYSLYKYSGISMLTEMDGKVLFRANDGRFGYELWISDGTGPGTTLHTNIEVEPTTNSSSPHSFVRLGRRLYFAATDSVHGYELWTTDGQYGQDGPGGTHMVTDLNPGSGSSDPRDLLACEGLGSIFFSASDGTTRWTYVFDEATGKTTRVGGKADVKMDTAWVPTKADWIVALAQVAGSGFGLEPHVYDKPSNSFKILADTNPGTADGEFKLPIELGFKHQFAFRSKGKLFKSEGTPATTKEVKTPGITWVGENKAFRSKISFLGKDASGNAGAYEVDPTTGKTQKFHSAVSMGAQAFGSPFVAGDGLCYLATLGTKDVLYRLDQNATSGKQISTASFLRLQPVENTTEQDTTVGVKYGLDDTSIFFGLTLGGVEVWKADAKGASRIGTQTFTSVSSAITLGSRRVACVAKTSANGNEVYVIDDTKVSMVSDALAPGFSSGAMSGSGLWAMQNWLFFSGADALVYGTEIFGWRTGALSQAYGTAGSRPYVFQASDAVMGKNLLLRTDVDANAAAVITILSTPTLIRVRINGSRFYMNLNNMVMLFAGIVQGQSLLTIPVPNQPRFLGMQVEGQALVVDLQLAMYLTQAVSISIGQ